MLRLYDYFKPREYNLSLNIEPEEPSLQGVCEITGELAEASDRILLHSKDLEIKTIEVDGLSHNFSIEEDILSIELPEKQSGQRKITINYSVKITPAMHGIYSSKSHDGKTIISTQFESHHAREAFPCIDEPAAKSTFAVSITAPKDMVVLFNTTAQDKTYAYDRQTLTFLKTPVMSTYLLAFVIGDLHSISATTKDGVDVSIWSTTDHDKDAMNFALEVTVKTLEFLNNYFGVAYPLPKLDQVAIPDFSSGAMENWGLVTYREIALLADPEDSSIYTREHIALVIAHELSHQWFGNLVTMQWWNDLWLNESFATMMEYIVINNIYPEWGILTNFVASESLSASRRDILPGVQPVKCEVNHPDEISTLFDPSIVYAKGSRLLWMMYCLVGENSFRKAMNEYFTTYRFSNTVGDDLWDCLDKHSKFAVKDIMNSWISNPGLPMITIDQNENNVTITQEQLITEPSAQHNIWPVPLWPNYPLGIDILEESQYQTSASHNIIINDKGGHYVSRYLSEATNQEIMENIASKQFPPDNRLQLINDSLLLNKCNKEDIHNITNKLLACKSEDNEAVWRVVAVAISDLRVLAEEDETTNQKLKNFVQSIIQQSLDHFGSKNKLNGNQVKLKSIIYSLALYSEDKQLIAKLNDDFKNFHDIRGDLRLPTYVAAVKFGPKKNFDELINYYHQVTDPDIKTDIASAVCSTKDSAQIEQLLGYFKNQQIIRLQEVDRFFIYLLRNRHAKSATWNWLTTNWDWIIDNFASDKSYDSYPRYAAMAFSTKDWLVAYQKHFNPMLDEPSIKRNIELGIKDIESKIRWRDFSFDSLKSELADF